MPTSSETPAGQSNIAVPIAPIAPKPKTETLADLNRRKEIAEEDIKRITTVLTAATQNHETTTRLKVELRDLGDELDAINRAIADPELAQAVWDETDAELLADLDAAITRQQNINEDIVKQTGSVEAAQKALDAATSELMRLKFKISGGTFEATQRLTRHRQQRPIGGETQ